MDHDADNKMLHKVVRFLDATTAGEWRDEATWRRWQRSDGPALANVSGGDGGAAMVHDAEQTKKDRIALGYDVDPDAPAKEAGEPTAEELQAQEDERHRLEQEKWNKDAGNAQSQEGDGGVEQQA